MLDVAIIGCGVVGAAAAYELSHYRCMWQCWKQKTMWRMEQRRQTAPSLHAGYDPEPGTQMARLNVQGVALARKSAPGWMCPTASAAAWCWR